MRLKHVSSLLPHWWVVETSCGIGFKAYVVMNEDTPKTNSVAYDVGGEQHDQGAIVPVGFARQLERELLKTKTDLADALRELYDTRYLLEQLKNQGCT